MTLLVDNRKERPGVKFKDADLIGLPIRLTLGKRGFESGQGELVVRAKGEKLEVPLDQISKIILELYEQI